MKIHIRSLRLAALLAGLLLLTGCAETQLVSHWAKKVSWPGQAESQGAYKVGNPYKVGKVWYYPEENFRLVETGIASWYGPGFHNAQTANGEVFDQNELTAAHRTLQLPSLARVTNLENGRSVVVRVNDRGPFKNGRIMDVSRRTAELLGFINKGTARVRIEVLEKESRILAAASKRGEDTTRMTLADIRGKKADLSSLPEKAAKAPAKAASAQPARVASVTDDGLPESLRTPTITVEELSASGARVSYTPPPQQQPMAAGQVESGRFMPAAVVTRAPVHQTRIFVQAGSFAVYDNAERLSQRLSGIAPVVIEPVTVSARKLYRVKLGPLDSVTAADRVLEEVIRVGDVVPKIIRD
jgi:rare lipoprotein A